MKRIGAAAVIAMFLGGCASSSQAPVAAYPTKGQSAERQSRDVGECQTWAKQQTNYDPAGDTLKGAGVGTLLGGAVGAGGGAAAGAATGSGAGKGAATGAVIGGVAGGVAGGAYQYSKSKEGYEKAYTACMQGRGYSVSR
jgi:outer membrane lipoprotein SlyB